MNTQINTSQSLSSAPARGMRDFLPSESALRDWAIAELLKVYQQFGFTRIETPALENISNLRRGEGGENLQLIFEVLKRGDKLDKVLAETPIDRAELADLGLRFDLTVPLVRFYAHNQSNLPSPFKSIQAGPVWRAESPQAGRFRQFTQCDIDLFGVKSEIAEMELIQATAEALLALGFKNFTVRLNDRRILLAIAEFCGFAPEYCENLFIQIDKLDKIGLAGIEKELHSHGHDPQAISKLMALLSNLLSDESKQQSIEARLPANLDAEVVTRLKNVMKAIATVSQDKYTIEFDPTLVRGMGYYTGQIFEIVAHGYAHSIAGGGRYDKMVGKMTGRDVPACGFSIGFERIIAILSEQSAIPYAKPASLALIFDPERDVLESVLVAANHLRQEGKAVSLQPRKKDMRKQIDSLAKQGFDAYAIFKGEPSNLEIKVFM